MTELVKPRLLDLFCGMGGWSIGFKRQGFRCTGLDITDLGYPYDFVQTDIRDVEKPLGKFDVVVASPPCQYYSQARNTKPREYWRGDELVKEAARVITLHEPQWWIMENVRGAVPHISKILGAKPVYARGPQFLWGKFPLPLVPEQNFRKLGFWTNDTSYDRRREDYIKLRQAIRSIIPLGLAEPIAEACNHTNAKKESST